MRKVILYVLGVLVLALASWVSYLLVSKEKVKRPAPVKQVKTVFTDTVLNRAVPIEVKANGNLIAKTKAAPRTFADQRQGGGLKSEELFAEFGDVQ